ncbi:MAG: S-layer homology domain-containing protein [Clostridia bacterium]|nr:S-layer homology domain-containing protein [Clostridia bacterium]
MKKRLSTVFLVLMITLVLGLVPSVYANGAEAECNGCNEIITIEDVTYDDEGNAMCIHCEELLSGDVLKQLSEEEETAEEELTAECTNCGELIYGDEIEYDDENVLICPHCAENQDSDEDADLGDSEALTLNTSDWAKVEAEEALSKDLIPFEMLSAVLKNDITREEFAVVAVKLYERITGKEADYSIENLPFTDCSTKKSYTRYVAAAYKLGVTNGTSDTTFSPEAIITREQLATMLYRVLLKAEGEGFLAKEIETSDAVFNDEGSISDYAKESVSYMAQRKIINGVAEGIFAPQSVATKEQAILISNRITNVLYK